MKRFVAIFILILYTAFSVGLTMYNHYCGGKLASVTFFNAEKKGCSKCGKKMSKDCCKDTEQNLTLDDSQLGSTNSFIFSDYTSFVAILPSFNYEFQPEFAIINSNTSKFFVFETGPPKTPIYIQIQSLLI